MKPAYRLLWLVVFYSAIKISANPIAPICINEIQVVSPTNWQIELTKSFIPSCGNSDTCVSTTLALKTNRYPDTFHLNLKTTKTQTFVIVTPKSIVSPILQSGLQIGMGDTVFLLAPISDSIYTVGHVIVSCVGKDSSLCACSWGYFVKTNTPTIGSVNIFPFNTVNVYILSSTDSLPVYTEGTNKFGLYSQWDAISCPSIFHNLPIAPLVLGITQCQSISYYIGVTPCGLGGKTYARLNISYIPGAPSKNDTIFVDYPSNASLHVGISTENLRKVPFTPSMSVISLPSSLMFLIKDMKNNTCTGQLRIMTVNGRVVREHIFTIDKDGTYSFNWDKTDSKGRNVKTGLYFAVFSFNGNKISNKFTLHDSKD